MGKCSIIIMERFLSCVILCVSTELVSFTDGGTLFSMCVSTRLHVSSFEGCGHYNDCWPKQGIDVKWQKVFFFVCFFNQNCSSARPGLVNSNGMEKSKNNWEPAWFSRVREPSGDWSAGHKYVSSLSILVSSQVKTWMFQVKSKIKGHSSKSSQIRKLWISSFK